MAKYLTDRAAGAIKDRGDYKIKMTKKDGAKSNNYKKINISSACFTAFRILNAR